MELDTVYVYIYIYIYILTGKVRSTAAEKKRRKGRLVKYAPLYRAPITKRHFGA